MMYIREPSTQKFQEDLARFIRGSDLLRTDPRDNGGFLLGARPASRARASFRALRHPPFVGITNRVGE